MRDGLTLGNPRTEAGADFFRRVFNKPPRTPVEIAQREARDELIRVATLIERAEYLRANREREAIIRDHCINGLREGETYSDYHNRLNEPLRRAADRINEQLAEFEMRRAA
jgi:hypothetical protein